LKLSKINRLHYFYSYITMPLILAIILCVWAVYSSQRFIPFYIKSFNNPKKRIILELPKQNMTLNITFREPTITFPKIYLDDAHQIIMLFQ